MNDNRWTGVCIMMKEAKRDLTLDRGTREEKFAGKTLQKLAQDRQLWKDLEKAFV